MDDARDLDDVFLSMIDERKVSGVAAELGVPEKTIYAQSLKIRKQVGSLSGNTRRRFIEYRLRTQTPEGPGTGIPEGTEWPSETEAGPTPDEAREGPGPETWDVTEWRRRIREAFDRRDGLQNWNVPTDASTQSERVPGVVSDEAYEDEEAFFGVSAALLLGLRRNQQKITSWIRRPNGVLMPYERSILEQVRMAAEVDLNWMEFELIDRHGLTMPPHKAPFDDMQRLDALEGLARNAGELDLARRARRRLTAILDWPTFFLWWPLRAWLRPPASGRRKTGRKAAKALVHVDSCTDAVATRYASYREMVEDLPRQLEFAEFALSRPLPNGIFRPYHRLQQDLMNLEILLECRLLEYSVVRPLSATTHRRDDADEGPILSGMEGKIYDLMLTIEHIRSVRFLINTGTFAPWWTLRPVAWALRPVAWARTLSKFRRKTA